MSVFVLPRSDQLSYSLRSLGVQMVKSVLSLLGLFGLLSFYFPSLSSYNSLSFYVNVDLPPSFFLTINFISKNVSRRLHLMLNT